MVFSLLLRLTASGCPSGIFKLFLHNVWGNYDLTINIFLEVHENTKSLWNGNIIREEGHIPTPSVMVVLV